MMENPTQIQNSGRPAEGPDPAGQSPETVAETEAVNPYAYQTVAAPPPPVLVDPRIAVDPNLSIREEIRQRRLRERETGVPFMLPFDQIEVRVRLLNLHEKNTLVGMPDELREMMLRGFNDGNSEVIPPAGKRTEEDMFKVMDLEEEAANAACLVGFVWPSLRATRAEADAENDPNVWALEDLTKDDRLAYFALISGQNPEAMARIMAFQRGERITG